MHKKWETRLVRRWQAFAQNPYQHLLLSLLFIFLAFIFLDSDDAFSAVAINALFLLAVLFVIETFNLSQKFLQGFRSIAIVSFLINSFIILFLPEDIWAVTIINRIIQFIFMVSAIWIILKRIFKDKNVTKDTLTGGISVYLMLGLAWFELYQILNVLDPQAFSQTMTYYKTFYFSFVTLTTVGYGDIVPVHRAVMILANLEAIVGQMYPAIIISRLVSLYIQEKKER